MELAKNFGNNLQHRKKNKNLRMPWLKKKSYMPTLVLKE
jgi:hypothetical protein